MVNGPADHLTALRDSLRPVSNDDRIIGRFHFEFEEDSDWRKTVTGLKDDPGIVLIRPGEFGMNGTAMHQLSLDADNADITTVLLAANVEFAKTTEKRVYSRHFARGQDLGVYFEGGVPYGEDRDGDGQIDRGGRGGFRGPRGGRPRRSSGTMTELSRAPRLL